MLRCFVSEENYLNGVHTSREGNSGRCSLKNQIFGKCGYGLVDIIVKHTCCSTLSSFQAHLLPESQLAYLFCFLLAKFK